ncbi:MAG TPA: zinc ribbon domain-containing protein [Candidatus Saccharimonadales bacterium]|nr:zinc ribbon domain-containing protein [Candidatus Saccharimonadales bacterium]
MINCPTCNQANPQGSQWCGMCGNSIPQSPPVAPGPAQQNPAQGQAQATPQITFVVTPSTLQRSGNVNIIWNITYAGACQVLLDGQVVGMVGNRTHMVRATTNFELMFIPAIGNPIPTRQTVTVSQSQIQLPFQLALLLLPFKGLWWLLKQLWKGVKWFFSLKFLIAAILLVFLLAGIRLFFWGNFSAFMSGYTRTSPEATQTAFATQNTGPVIETWKGTFTENDDSKTSVELDVSVSLPKFQGNWTNFVGSVPIEGTVSTWGQLPTNVQKDLDLNLSHGDDQIAVSWNGKGNASTTGIWANGSYYCFLQQTSPLSMQCVAYQTADASPNHFYLELQGSKSSKLN